MNCQFWGPRGTRQQLFPGLRRRACRTLLPVARTACAAAHQRRARSHHGCPQGPPAPAPPAPTVPLRHARTHLLRKSHLPPPPPSQVRASKAPACAAARGCGATYTCTLPRQQSSEEAIIVTVEPMSAALVALLSATAAGEAGKVAAVGSALAGGATLAVAVAELEKLKMMNQQSPPPPSPPPPSPPPPSPPPGNTVNGIFYVGSNVANATDSVFIPSGVGNTVVGMNVTITGSGRTGNAAGTNILLSGSVSANNVTANRVRTYIDIVLRQRQPDHQQQCEHLLAPETSQYEQALTEQRHGHQRRQHRRAERDRPAGRLHPVMPHLV